MERSIVTERLDDVQRLAADLLNQSERCALTGLLSQAAALLKQVWLLAETCDPGLAATAAWESGWICVRRGHYAEAATWFNRVDTLPTSSLLWPDARQTLIQLCASQISSHTALPSEPQPTSHTSPTVLPTLNIRSLGTFQITQAGRVLPTCRSRKALTLFRYLLTRRQHAAHKEELMELLWPESPPREAAHSLHVAISALRRYLDVPGDSYLILDTGYYLINPEATLDDDCTTFRCLSDEGERWQRAGDLQQAQRCYTDAIACYQGDYWVDDRDLSWAVIERERLLARYLLATDNLGRILMSQGHFEAAARSYERLLERDGYREDAYCQLMRCYWQLGRRSEVRRHYERCVATLANDLGVEPLAETTQLYQMIMTSENTDSINRESLLSTRSGAVPQRWC